MVPSYQGPGRACEEFEQHLALGRDSSPFGEWGDIGGLCTTAGMRVKSSLKHQGLVALVCWVHAARRG